MQVGDGRHREPLPPPTHGARGGHDLYLAEAAEQRIILDEGEGAQPPAADDQQPDQQPHHGHRAEIPPAGRPGAGGADRRIEPGRAQVAPEQLKPGIRRERHIREFQLEIPIDSRA